jgi:inner membrane protein
MHIQTHILSGWCLGNLFKLTPKESFFCMIAASILDVDGFGFFISNDFYWDYHHLLSHNIFFILLATSILTFFSRTKIKAFLIFFGLMHIHLIMDYFGSGYGWQIKYFWPASYWSIWYQKAWPFFGWQNKAFGLGFLAWTIAMIFIQRRTFFEWPMPSLDKQIVQLAEKLKNKLK